MSSQAPESHFKHAIYRHYHAEHASTEHSIKCARKENNSDATVIKCSRMWIKWQITQCRRTAKL